MLNTKDEIFVTVIIITAFALLFVVVIVMAAILFYNRKKRHSQEKANFEQILMQSRLEIKEQTLRHIAYELHDNLGQVASLIKINLNTVRVENSVETAAKIEDTKDLVRQLITDLKALSIDMNADRVVQLGLVSVLTNEVDRVRRSGMYKVDFRKPELSPDLSSNHTIILYRMVQEMISNSIKHSNASQLGIFLEVRENLFTLVYSDNGVGFNVNEKTGSGAGLKNLQDRARLMNGQVTIQSSLGNGVRIRIELPT